MAKQPTDLVLTSKQAEAVLTQWQGSGVKCSCVEQLQGGMCHSVLRLHFDRSPFHAVIKLQPRTGL